MHLVVFDIDGTLTETKGIDEACFVRAVEDTLSIRVKTDWTVYRDVTDSGILAELVESSVGRLPTRVERERVEAQFCELLEVAFAANPRACLSVGGGPALLTQLGALDQLALAVATGGWERSARLKLSRAGYEAEDLVLASASDASSRHEIMVLAKERACARCGAGEFDSITYIGDAPWDYEAATALGWGFIGIGRGRSADVLKRLGATTILADFRDPLVLESQLLGLSGPESIVQEVDLDLTRSLQARLNSA
jgi:phosphoglycolate phosphatase-like HAD superfamily hydrolase